ncbi:MAG: hypothetical protein HYU39_06220 [Thaumarchaeota archaeon]|nr:hypothetical protein [Nitrososphaerota archaeon]
MERLDIELVKGLIQAELRKEIDKRAASHPSAEGHEFIEEISIERVEELGKGSYKVFFNYVISYISSHRLYDDRLQFPNSGFVRVNESLQIEEMG